MLAKTGLGALLAALAIAFGAAASAQAEAPATAGDALKVTFCGTGGPLPIRDRAKSCVVVQAGDGLYLVDIGPDATNNIQQWRMPIAKTRAVFITHLHSDHIGDLGEFNMQSWVAGRPGPLPVYGPSGTADLTAGFNQAYAADHGFRRAHHEHGDIKLPIEAGLLEPHVVVLPAQPDAGGVIRKVVWNKDGLTVTAIAVNHFPIVPAFGYRFDYKGRSVVISGDTIKWPPLAKAAAGADLLIHEAQNSDMTKKLVAFLASSGQTRLSSVMSDTLTYHTTPIEAAEIARDAHVKALVLTHLTQAGLPLFTPEAFTKGIEATGFANWRLASDGMTVTLPVGGDQMVFGHY